MLGYLAKESTHGYELYQLINTDLAQIWHLSMSQIYNILARLENKTLIRAEEEVQENQRVRKMLHLTESGRAHFEAWLFKPSPCSGRALRIEFLTRHYFMQRLHPERIPQMISEQILQIEHDLTVIESMQQKIDASDFYNSSAVQLKIDQLHTFQHWFNQLQQEQST